MGREEATVMVDMNSNREFGVTAEQLQRLSEVKAEEVARLVEEQGGLVGLLAKVQSSPQGLEGRAEDLARRRRVFGENWIRPKEAKTFLRLLWEAFLDPLLIILTVFAVIAFGLTFYTIGGKEKEGEVSTEWIEPVAIIAAVVLVMVVTAANDWKKEKQFRGLQQSVASRQVYAVARAGAMVQVPARELVVGDVMVLQYGDSVPADGLVLRSSDLSMDESAMTGEAELQGKGAGTVVLAGTAVMEGGGKALVTAVGARAQAGAIQALLAAEGQERSVLQAKLFRLTLWIGAAGLAAAILTTAVLCIKFALQYSEGSAQLQAARYIDFFMTGITILVVAIPEGLPLAVTISLAYSVKQMMVDNNLVRHLNACETMGNATTICTDKTGTLTTNRMTVVRALACGADSGLGTDRPLVAELEAGPLGLLAQAIVHNSSYSTDLCQDGAGAPTQVGNRTECALLGLLAHLGIDHAELRRQVPEDDLVKVFPFHSSRKRMSTVLRTEEGELLFLTKGAAEVVVARCTSVQGVEGSVEELDQAQAAGTIADMAEASLRTICVAYRQLEEGEVGGEEEELCRELTCLAVLGIEDPVRPEVPAAIQQCQQAGITVRMVTGDNLVTAKAIAVRCGILDPTDPTALAMDGEEFNRRVVGADGEVRQELVDKVWPRLRVLARSKPQDKYNLVRGIIHSRISAGRQVVAVTGDGTNDAPALKEADVGFAMGLAGTDVAKEASDIILTDDNFNSIVKAVMWGRNVYDSIAKFLQFQLTVNCVAVVVALVGACAMDESPLAALQMLWVNLIMDTLAALALATEKPSAELLLRQPYGRTASLVSPVMARNILGQAAYQLGALLALTFLGHRLPRHCLAAWGETEKQCTVENWTDHTAMASPNQLFTMVFNSFIMMTLFNEINSRKVHGERMVVSHLTSNPLFVVIWLTSFALQVVIVQTPGLNSMVFQTRALTLFQWAVCLALGLGSLIVYQLAACLPLPAAWAREEQEQGELGEEREERGWGSSLAQQVATSAEPLLKLRLRQELRPLAATLQVAAGEGRAMAP